jgi:hypothetical protein
MSPSTPSEVLSQIGITATSESSPNPRGEPSTSTSYDSPAENWRKHPRSAAPATPARPRKSDVRGLCRATLAPDGGSPVPTPVDTPAANHQPHQPWAARHQEIKQKSQVPTKGELRHPCLRRMEKRKMSPERLRSW